MAQRRRMRHTLVAAPIAVSLVLLLAVGVLDPHLVESGPGPAAYRWLVALAGAVGTGAPALAALRVRGRLRGSWAATATTGMLWTAAVLTALTDGDHPSTGWVLFRAGACVSGVLALLLAPGVGRTIREWGLVILDGWLVSGSVFLIGWLALVHTGSRGGGVPLTDRPTLLWVPMDLLAVSVISGLAMRADRSARVPVVMMVLVSLLSVTGDCTWALADVPHFAIVQWIILMAALAASTAGPGLDIWRAPAAEQSRPRLVRWPQVAVVPGLAAAVSGPTGPLVAAVAISVIVTMVAEILLVSRANGELWQALRSQAVRLDLVIRASRDAIVQVNSAGAVEFANDAAADVLGCPPQELVGRPFLDRMHPEDRAAFRDHLGQLTDPTSWVRVSSRFRHPDGTLRHLEATVSRRLVAGEDEVAAPFRTGGGYTLLARDVTERIRQEAELRRLASSDALTGLLNRHAFLTVLAQRLATGPAAVLFLDLDGFKTVNDVHGHAAGDRLLVEAAQGLRSVLGVDDVAARLGGDEFAVLEGSGDRHRACLLATRITDRLRRLPSDVAGATSASVGVAVGQDVAAEQLLADADLAMYQAKADGGGRHSLYDPLMRATDHTPDPAAVLG